MNIYTTQPPYEGVANTRDHFANFSMQNTVQDSYKVHRNFFMGYTYISSHKVKEMAYILTVQSFTYCITVGFYAVLQL